MPLFDLIVKDTNVNSKLMEYLDEPRLMQLPSVNNMD